MVKFSINVHSKTILLAYLAVIALLLVLWISRLNFHPAEKRDIPVALQAYIQSPVKPLPQILLYNLADNRVFTNASLQGQWSFVYFTHGFCFPACQQQIALLHSLRSHFVSNSHQFLLINYDPHPASTAVLKNLAEKEDYAGLQFLAGVPEQLAPIIETLNFLYLKTQTQAGYYLEQEQKLYLIDPQGRFFARFNQLSVDEVIPVFVAIREFYARSE